MTLAPKVLMTLCRMMLPTETKLCCRMLGMATMATLPSMFQEKSTTLWVDLKAPMRRNTTTMASTQLTPWHRKVAHATPATPILKPATNRISTPMLDRDETARK